MARSFYESLGTPAYKFTQVAQTDLNEVRRIIGRELTQMDTEESEIPYTPMEELTDILYAMCKTDHVQFDAMGPVADKLTQEELLRVGRVMKKYPQVTPSILVARFMEYNRKLIDQYAVSLEEAADWDRITIPVYNELAKVLHMEGDPSGDPIMQAVKEAMWKSFYAIVPCYTKARLDYGYSMTFLYEVTDINLDEQTMDILLTAYHMPDSAEIAAHHDPTLITQLGVTIHYSTEFGPENGNIPLKLDINHAINPSEMYQTFNLKKFTNWTKDERVAFNQVFGKFMDYQIKDTTLNLNIEEDRGKDAFNTVCGYERVITFLYGIGVANLALRQNAQKTRKPNPSKEKESKHIGQFSEEDQSVRKTRIIEGVTFNSVDTPRESSFRTVREYKVATWTIRGHTRTYKNGKTVYIEPTVGHRKCLVEEAKTAQPAPNTIRIGGTNNG